MLYNEAILKAKQYKLNEWDFKTLDGFIFAVEFFEEEEICKKREKQYIEDLKGHSFNHHYECRNCQINQRVFYDCRYKFSCKDIQYLLESGKLNLEQITEKMKSYSRYV